METGTIYAKTGIPMSDSQPQVTRNPAQIPDGLDLKKLVYGGPENAELFNDYEIDKILSDDPAYRTLSNDDFMKLQRDEITKFRTIEEKHPNYPLIERVLSKTFARDNGNSPVDVEFSIQRHNPDLETRYDPEQKRLYMRTKSKDAYNTNSWHPYDPERENLNLDAWINEPGAQAKELLFDAVDMIPDAPRYLAAAALARYGALKGELGSQANSSPKISAMGYTAGGISAYEVAKNSLGKYLGYRKEVDPKEALAQGLTDAVFIPLVGTGVSTKEVKRLIQDMPVEEVLKRVPEQFTGRRARQVLEDRAQSFQRGLLEKTYRGFKDAATQFGARTVSVNADVIKNYAKNEAEINIIKRNPLKYVATQSNNMRNFVDEEVGNLGKQLGNVRDAYSDLPVETSGFINLIDDKIAKIGMRQPGQQPNLSTTQLDQIADLQNLKSRVGGIYASTGNGRGIFTKLNPVESFRDIENLRHAIQAEKDYFTNPAKKEARDKLYKSDVTQGVLDEYYAKVKEAHLNSLKRVTDENTHTLYPSKMIKGPDGKVQQMLSPGDQLAENYDSLLEEFIAAKGVQKYVHDFASSAGRLDDWTHQYKAYNSLIQNDSAKKMLLARLEDKMELAGKLAPGEKGSAEKLDIAHKYFMIPGVRDKIIEGPGREISPMAREVAKAMSIGSDVPRPVAAALQMTGSLMAKPVSPNMARNMYNAQQTFQKWTGENLESPWKQVIGEGFKKRYPVEIFGDEYAREGAKAVYDLFKEKYNNYVEQRPEGPVKTFLEKYPVP